jgi:hypothetical protein
MEKWFVRVLWVGDAGSVGAKASTLVGGVEVMEENA